MLIIVGCSESKIEVKKTDSIDCENEGYINVQEWRKEILSLDSVKFKDEPFLKNTLEYYQKIFGNPIESYNITHEDIGIYSDKQSQKIRHVFDGITIDQIGNQAIVNTLDLEILNGYLDIGDLALKAGTSVTEICKKYPRSCRLISSNGNLWSGFIELRVHHSGLDFRRIFLIFQKEKLKMIKIVNFSID